MKPHFDTDPERRRKAARSLDNIRDMIAATESLDGPGIVAFAHESGHTQAALADASGLTPVTITSLKHGGRLTRSSRAAIRFGLARLIAGI